MMLRGFEQVPLSFFEPYLLLKIQWLDLSYSGLKRATLHITMLFFKQKSGLMKIRDALVWLYAKLGLIKVFFYL